MPNPVRTQDSAAVPPSSESVKAECGNLGEEMAISPIDFRALYPKITEMEWDARDQLRRVLKSLLERQVEIFDERHHEIMRQCVAGPSAQERAEAIVPVHPDTEVIERMEDSSFRQILRLSHLLIRMKREVRLSDGLGSSSVSTEVAEKKPVRGFSPRIGESSSH